MLVIRKTNFRKRGSGGTAARLTLLLIALIGGASLSASAQVIYAENRIPADGVQLEYRLTIRDPNTHIYLVEMDIRGIVGEELSVSMPAWSPGAYRIRNFARDVQNFEVRTRSGRRRLAWTKTDKLTWRVAKGADDDVVVTYQVYSNGLTYEMADISGPSTYMYVVGNKHVPVALRYEKPRDWDVYSGLARRRGAYRAADYDVFIDAPAFVGEFKILEFTSDEIPYRMVFSDPDVEFIEEQVIGDIQSIVDAAVAIFGRAPYPDYTFLFKVQPGAGSGGLEHLNSTRITVGINDFSSGTRYERFLFVVAHEFFHLWNVKRIRPEGLGPFDYTREVSTRSLWISEGLTSYYGRLLLARAGIYTPRGYLDSVGLEIDKHQELPGRRLMSAEESSWETWARSDNSDNNTISYYTKGEIAGMLLDIEIRARTHSEKSLDDVMRYLMVNYGAKGVGFPEDAFLEALNSVAGTDFGEIYTHLVQSRAELNYDRYIGQAGLQIQAERQPSALFMGVQVEEADGNTAQVVRVIQDSPAERAGVDDEDILVAFDDQRITFTNFEGRFRRRKLGEKLDLTVLRGNKLLHLELEPGEIQATRWVINEANTVTPEQLELRIRWIGEIN